jgi:Icc-related predicted phosphoesterase
MKIWHISDTHGYHDLLSVPSGVDLVIHSGDAANYRDPYRNEHEYRTFLIWLESLPIRYKIVVAGNHDSSLERKLITSTQMLNDYGVIYLEDESVHIEDLKIYGSPWTPEFNNWAFNKKRNKINKIWDMIPEDTDILVTHGPPKGVMDISDAHGSREIHFCGCSALKKKVLKLNLQFHMFGHIHNFKDHINQGTRKLPDLRTTFSNGSIVKDGDFGKKSSNGNIFEII